MPFPTEQWVHADRDINFKNCLFLRKFKDTISIQQFAEAHDRSNLKIRSSETADRNIMAEG